MDEPDICPLSPQETVLNDSRLTTTGNGNNRPVCVKPTSGHKMWAAILLGLIFALVSSPATYHATSKLSEVFGGMATTVGPGPNLAGLLLHTLIFIGIARLLLW